MISETPEEHCPLLATDIAMLFDGDLVNIRDKSCYLAISPYLRSIIYRGYLLFEVKTNIFHRVI